MKILVKPLVEQNNVLFKTPLHKKVISKKVYGLLSVISPLLVLLIWQLISSLQIFPTQILVPPKTVWNTFIALLQSGELQMHLKDSLSRLFLGFSIATISAIAFGIAFGANTLFRNYTYILFNVFIKFQSLSLFLFLF